MRVAIVIPAHNAAQTIEACLDACRAQDYPDLELILVNNNSTDDTAAIATRFNVACIHETKRGPAAARNRGARESQADIIAFTDADCIPDPSWIAELVAGFSNGVAAVGGTYTNAAPHSLLARIVHEEIALRHERLPDEVDFLGSFNVAFRREVFDRAGGFDEAFTAASGEDNDLAYRIHAAGGHLRFNPAACVAHYHPTRLLPYLRTQMRHGFWRAKLYAKHPGKLSRGDGYAGLCDLLAPPLLLATLLSTSLLFLPGIPRAILAAITLLLAIACAAVHLPYVRIAVAMTRRTRDLRMLLFIPLAPARSLARGVGMLHGLWHFIILRRVSA